MLQSIEGFRARTSYVPFHEFWEIDFKVFHRNFDDCETVLLDSVEILHCNHAWRIALNPYSYGLSIPFVYAG